MLALPLSVGWGWYVCLALWYLSSFGGLGYITYLC